MAAEEERDKIRGVVDPAREGDGEKDAESASEHGTEETIETLRARLDQKEQAAQASQERYLRALADFDNYKKRIQKEQIDQARFANERLIKELLPVVDNLERALASSKETRDFARMVEGVELIHKQLLSVLEKFGVNPIESLQKPFDPFLHQSIAQVESDADSEENQVVGETQKGYFLNERVLRPSLVMVSKRKASSPRQESDASQKTDS